MLSCVFDNLLTINVWWWWDRRHTDRRQRKASLNASALWHNTVAIYWLALFPKMSLNYALQVSECKQLSSLTTS